MKSGEWRIQFPNINSCVLCVLHVVHVYVHVCYMYMYVYTCMLSPQSQPSQASSMSPLVGGSLVGAAANQIADLTMMSSIEECHRWLTVHNFAAYLSLFASYSGADLLRLSRRDLVELCGMADGIRLFNALRIRTLCTLYVSIDNELGRQPGPAPVCSV